MREIFQGKEVDLGTQESLKNPTSLLISHSLTENPSFENKALHQNLAQGPQC